LACFGNFPNSELVSKKVVRVAVAIPLAAGTKHTAPEQQQQQHLSAPFRVGAGIRGAEAEFYFGWRILKK